LKIAAKLLQMETVSCQHPIRWYHRQTPKPHCLATIPHDWHTIVRYDPSRSSKVNDSHVI